MWPILPGSNRPPGAWKGWPGGKQFAVVLTHDVEGSGGVEKCRQLVEIERELGFRSWFGFIPEGEYAAPVELMNDLRAEGFEVGVHDLYHDGWLYRTRSRFETRAARINDYLHAWGATGFRSGFMLRRLDWLHALDIRYDASTFDTDPFEPEPDGVGTIFPFLVRPSARGCGVPSNGCGGYVELPYTLPQDSTLFRVFRETSPEIWLRKVDWIAENGGMVLVDTHPDYMAMGSKEGGGAYPVQFYERLLEYMRIEYAGAFWQALPGEVADYSRLQYAIEPQGPCAGLKHRILS